MMNLTVLVLATCTSSMLAFQAIVRQIADARNIRRLAEHFGWARADAAEIYNVARQIGFGAACQAIRLERQRSGA